MIMKKYFLASAWAIAAALVFLGNIGSEILIQHCWTA